MLIKLNLQRFAKATSQVSIDLTTLSGWGDVADGQHSIQVVAKADGYKDSEKSTAVSFTKGAEQDELAGTWVFNDTITATSANTYDVSFICNNESFTSITFSFSGTPTPSEPEVMFIINYNDTTSYYDTWLGEAYKTITITSKLSEVTNGDQLLAWLQVNATKQ